jgi:hypothetical protein
MIGTKEKAKELVNKFEYAKKYSNSKNAMSFELAKQCALICVNELLTFREALFINEGSMAYLYLKEVKEEIEKL